MITLRGGPGADGSLPPLKLPSRPPYNEVSRDLRPRLTCMVCLVAQASRLCKMQAAHCQIRNASRRREKEKMIISVGTKTPYATIFSDGKREATCDTSLEKGGSGSGFSPVDLLEAAFACCLNITLRRYADQHQIPLSEAKVSVSLNRDNPEQTVFEYGVELQGDLTAAQRQKLMEQAASCTVRKTLSKQIAFRSSP